MEDLQRIVIVNLYKHTSQELTNSATMVCKLSVTFSYSMVTFDRPGTLTGVADSTPLPLPYTVNVKQINNGLRASLDYTSFTEGLEILSYGKNDFRSAPFIRLLLLSQNSTSIEDASNSDIITRGADVVYRGLVTQLAKQYLLVANTTQPSLDLKGSLSYAHQRLFVQARTLRFIDAILGIVTPILLVLTFQGSAGKILQDTTSIARFVSAMLHSNTLNERLLGTGLWSLRNIGPVLQGTFHSCVEMIQHDCSIAKKLYRIHENQQPGSYRTNKNQQYWRPMTLAWYSQVGVLFVPLALIIMLEVTLRTTQRNEGLLDVVQQRDVQLGTDFVPAMVMALWKLLYSGFDFDLRLVDPYF